MRKHTTRYLLVAALTGALASWSFSAATQTVTEHIDQQGEYLVLASDFPPRNYGCGSGQTCEGWSADHGCLGGGGNPHDGIVTWRPLPGDEERTVTFWFRGLDQSIELREHVWTTGTATRRIEGCGLRRSDMTDADLDATLGEPPTSPPPLRNPRSRVWAPGSRYHGQLHSRQWDSFTGDVNGGGPSRREGFPVYDTPHHTVCGYDGAYAGQCRGLVLGEVGAGEWVRVPVRR